MGRKIDLTGKKFGRLFVESEAEKKNGKIMWKCICECGNVVYVCTHSLTGGNTKSCGCYQKYMASITGVKHSETQKTRLYNIWSNMKVRCLCQTHRDYDAYGGRGITVCQEWADSYIAFRDWSMANGYDDTKTLDRINNNESYNPKNCRWTTYLEQENNKRNNRIVELNGVRYTISELARLTGINYFTLHSRITRLGMSPEEAVNYVKKFRKDNTYGRNKTQSCSEARKNPCNQRCRTEEQERL